HPPAYCGRSSPARPAPVERRVGRAHPGATPLRETKSSSCNAAPRTRPRSARNVAPPPSIEHSVQKPVRLDEVAEQPESTARGCLDSEVVAPDHRRTPPPRLDPFRSLAPRYLVFTMVPAESQRCAGVGVAL